MVSQGSFALRIAGSAVHLYSILRVYELMSASALPSGCWLVAVDQTAMETHFDLIDRGVKSGF